MSRHRHTMPTLHSASIASYFECCRPEVAQMARMIAVLSKLEMVRDFTTVHDVERIYNTDTGHHSNSSKTDYYDSSTRSTTLAYY